MIKNALRSLFPDGEAHKLREKQEKFYALVGKYFYDRQFNNSKNSESIYHEILTEAVTEEIRTGLQKNSASEQAYLLIRDFREFEAKVKGWK